jgi:hypothetical protein
MINLCVGGRERPGLVCVGMLRIGGRAMMYKVYAAFIMSLSVALTLASPGAAHDGGLNVDVYRPTSGDIHFTCTYDVPWDWVHRCPPVVSPPEPPPLPVVRAPGCLPQAVTVPGADGKDQTVSMVRC